MIAANMCRDKKTKFELHVHLLNGHNVIMKMNLMSFWGEKNLIEFTHACYCCQAINCTKQAPNKCTTNECECAPISSFFTLSVQWVAVNNNGCWAKFEWCRSINVFCYYWSIGRGCFKWPKSVFKLSIVSVFKLQLCLTENGMKENERTR